MKKKHWILLLSTAAYSYLFYEQAAGINFLIFTLLVIAMLVVRDRNVLRSREWMVYAAGSLVSAVCILLYGNFLSFAGNFVSLSLLGAASLYPGHSLFVNLFHSGLSYVLSPALVVRDLYRKWSNQPAQPGTENTATSAPGTNKLLKAIFVFIVPAIVLVVFFLLYRASNPIFDKFAELINFDWISFEWLFFTLGGLLLLYGFYYQRQIKRLSDKDLSRGNDLHQDSLKRSGKGLSIEAENQSGMVLLGLLNGLLLIVNIIDIIFLFAGAELPEGVTYSDFVHQGTGALILSIIFAILIILFYFRGRLNFYDQSGTLKILAYTWVLQNIFMVCSTAWRNQLYIDEYSLTYKRIGVYIYLLLCVAGLVITIMKIAGKKSNWYLFRQNAWVWYAVLVLMGLIAWDPWITSYNLERAEKRKETADYDYLLNLTHRNIPQLIEAGNTDTSLTGYAGLELDNFPGRGRDINFKSRLDSKIYRFLEDLQETDWRSWNITDARIRDHIYHHAGDYFKEVDLGYVFTGTLRLPEPFLKAEDLRLVNSGIESWAGIEQYPDLKALDLGGNRIENLDSLPKLPQLTKLDLGNNRLFSIEGLHKLPALQELNIGNNEYLYEINPVAQLAGLRSLNITGLPTDSMKVLEKLTALEVLVMRGMNFTRYDMSPVSLPALRTLDFSQNHRNDSQMEVTSYITAPQLEALYLDNCQLFNLNFLSGYAPVAPYHALKMLAARDNNLYNLEGIEKLNKLEKLYLGGNKLINVTELGQLKELQELDLRHNELKNLKGLEQLGKLRELDLSMNHKLKDWSALAGIASLRSLNVRETNLHTPSELGKLKQVKELNLTGNNLSDLEGIEEFTSLEVLVLSIHDVRDLSPLYQLKNLKYLYLFGHSDEQFELIKKEMPWVKVIEHISPGSFVISDPEATDPYRY